jgi:hypothetical protein
MEKPAKRGRPSKNVELEAQTLRLPGSLWRSLRVAAAMRNVSMVSMVEEALEQYIKGFSRAEKTAARE